MQEEGRRAGDGDPVLRSVALPVGGQDGELLLGQVWPEGEESAADPFLSDTEGGGGEAGAEDEREGVRILVVLDAQGEGDDLG